MKSLNWFDKNKFKEILAITDSNKFDYKNKIGEFMYTEIEDLVNKSRDNTISEIDAKKGLNAFKKIQNEGITKQKKGTFKQKELLNLFNNLLNITLTDKTLESESQENGNNKVESKKEENEKVESRKEENENEDEYENEYAYENENDDDDDDDDDDERIKNLNDNLHEIIDKSKSFEDQIESLKELEDLKDFCLIKSMMIKS